MVPRGGRPAVPGAARRSAGRGDRREGDLGRAVEVVDVVAEAVHPRDRQLARQRRARERGDLQRRQRRSGRASRRAGRGSAAPSPAPRRARRRGSVRSPPASPPGRSAAAAPSSRRSAGSSRSGGSPRSGRAAPRSSSSSRARKGIMSSSEASVISPSGLVRWAPFGVPVVPEVRITKRGLSGGGCRSESSPAAISCSTVGRARRAARRRARRRSARRSGSTPASRSPNSSS